MIEVGITVAIDMTKNQEGTSRTNHIARSYHNIRDIMYRYVIALEEVFTSMQIEVILTNPATNLQ